MYLGIYSSSRTGHSLPLSVLCSPRFDRSEEEYILRSEVEWHGGDRAALSTEPRVDYSPINRGADAILRRFRTAVRCPLTRVSAGFFFRAGVSTRSRVNSPILSAVLRDSRSEFRIAITTRVKNEMANLNNIEFGCSSKIGVIRKVSVTTRFTTCCGLSRKSRQARALSRGTDADLSRIVRKSGR